MDLALAKVNRQSENILAEPNPLLRLDLPVVTADDVRAELLRLWREGLKDTAAANRLGLKASNGIAKIRDGRTKQPDLRTCLMLADLLGRPANDVLEAYGYQREITVLEGHYGPARKLPALAISDPVLASVVELWPRLDSADRAAAEWWLRSVEIRLKPPGKGGRAERPPDRAAPGFRKRGTG